jgi:hypothetical protein
MFRLKLHGKFTSGKECPVWSLTDQSTEQTSYFKSNLTRTQSRTGSRQGRICPSARLVVRKHVAVNYNCKWPQLKIFSSGNLNIVQFVLSCPLLFSPQFIWLRAFTGFFCFRIVVSWISFSCFAQRGALGARFLTAVLCCSVSLCSSFQLRETRNKFLLIVSCVSDSGLWESWNSSYSIGYKVAGRGAQARHRPPPP